MTRRWCLGLVCVLALTSMLLARPGVLKTKDGQSFTGDISDNPDSDSVAITVHGVRTTLVRSSIESITYSGNFDQEFQQRLAKLGPADLQGHIDLARWALDNKQYDLARQAINIAQNLDPQNAEANALADTIRSSLALEAKRANATPPAAVVSAPPATAATTAPAEVTAAAVSRRYLSDEDINKIRQAELQPGDAATLRVSFAKGVKERYLATGDKNATQFNFMSPGQQAMAMLATGDPMIAKDIRILSDPGTLAAFRNRLQQRILTGCASSGCHGGTKGGDFYLYPNASESIPATYTNFYILNKYTHKVTAGGGFGGGEVLRSMIDRSQPNTSLLVQYALPTNVAQTPHPKADAWRPMFIIDQDPAYGQLLNWMGKELKPFVSDYGIQFDLPKPSTQPSTQATP